MTAIVICPRCKRPMWAFIGPSDEAPPFCGPCRREIFEAAKQLDQPPPECNDPRLCADMRCCAAGCQGEPPDDPANFY